LVEGERSAGAKTALNTRVFPQGTERRFRPCRPDFPGESGGCGSLTKEKKKDRRKSSKGQDKPFSGNVRVLSEKGAGDWRARSGIENRGARRDAPSFWAPQGEGGLGTSARRKTAEDKICWEKLPNRGGGGGAVTLTKRKKTAGATTDPRRLSSASAAASWGEKGLRWGSERIPKAVNGRGKAPPFAPMVGSRKTVCN